MSCSSGCACSRTSNISTVNGGAGVDTDVDSDPPARVLDETATYSARFRGRIRRLHATVNGDITVEQALAQWGEIVRVFGMEVAEQQLSAMERKAGIDS